MNSAKPAANSPKPAAQRSWTETDEPKVSKWLPITVLLILLGIGLYIFAVNMWWEEAPRTFAVAISVPEYEEGWLPQPAFPQWELSEVTEAFETKGLVPWGPIKNLEASTSNDILNALNDIGIEMGGERIEKTDTVIVYLRGHAINHRGQAYLVAKEFDRQELNDSGTDESELPHGVSLKVVFERLLNLKAGNVVLLADICDVTAAPQLGVIANNIPQLIEQALAELKTKQQVWVITPSTSLQPTHASALRKRTLLQSACEYAANSRHAANSDSFLSLATFYESILRYSDHVTEGTQTPILLSNAAQGGILDDSEAWQIAKGVSIARRNAAELPAAIEDAIASKTGEAATANKPATKEPQPAEATKETKAEEVVEQDPWLRYWQICDELRGRKNSVAGWSPVDFAIKSWRDSLVTAAQLERLHRIGDSDTSDIRNLIKALEALNLAIKSDSQTGNETDGLNQAWSQLKRDMTPESGKRPWSSPADLPADQQSKWLQVRANYRVYFDAMGQLSGWMDSALNEDAQNRAELLQGVRRLVDLIGELENELPNANESVLNKPLTPSRVTAIQVALDELNTIRSRHAKNALNALAKQVTWRSERVLQLLLQDTNLAFADRKQVYSAYAAITPNALIEPGVNNNVDVDGSKTLRSLINPSSTAGTLEHYASWSAVLAQAVSLTGEKQFGRAQESSSESLNKWGKSLLAATSANSTSDTTLRWKRSCLNDWDMFSASEGEFYEPGLLRIVSNDAGIVANVPASLQLPNQLECTVMRRNGTRIQNCWVQWSAQPPPSFNKSIRDFLRVSLPGAEGEIEAGKAFQASLLGGRLNLILATSMDQSELPQGISLRVGIGNDEDAKTMQWHDVIVTPPNPDRIDLYAKNLNPPTGTNDILFARTDPRESFGPVLRGLRVPAIDGAAKSSYEFYLANRSDNDKTVIAKIYYVESNRLVGNGSIEATAVARTKRDLSKLRPAFETTGPILLPKAQQSLPGSEANTNGQRMLLASTEQPAVAGATATGAASAAPVSPATRTSVGQFGLLCVVSEVAINEDKSIRDLDKSSMYWIECLPVNPYGELVKVVPNNAQGTFDLQIEVPKAEWTRWGLEAIKVDAKLTDANGVEIPSAGSNVELTADNLEGRLTIKPRVAIPDNTKAVAHLDIGGFNRAYAFDSRLRGEAKETVGATQAFSWIGTEGILCWASNGEPAPTMQMGDALVMPARLDADDKVLGKEVTIATMSIPFRIDFPRSGSRAVAELTLDEGREKQTFHFDRNFTPTFDTDGGNLVFSATVDDLNGIIPIPRSGLEGKILLEANVTDASNTRTTSSVNLIFDRKPPLKSAVEINSKELYLEESLDVSIAANDEDSSVKDVYFAIDIDGLKEGQYDGDDLLHLKANQFAGKWATRLEAAEIEKAKLRPGTYSIVCRSIDLAGNSQDENTSRKFTWTGIKRPVSAPPVKPASPPPAAMNEPKEHTVIVQVLVAGKAPAIPKNVSVAGIAGATEVNNGGTMIYTKVPDGSYEINATYEDAFGVKYAGKAKLLLSAGSKKQIPIDTIKQSK